MKFKKVEIQAFRAYDKVEDATFDFKRIEDGLNADFISLYAPNGFGKTSFYDAIEFGITNNIHRFLQRDKINIDTVKTGKNITSGKNQYFLRNNYSSEGLPSYIKLYTTDSEKPKINNIVKPVRRDGYDYKFKKSDTINKEFQTVILSQEWIDSFLKEEKPEDRYDTFIQYFGDTDIAKYYQNIVELISMNEKRIEGLKKDLNGIQLDLNFDGDNEILLKVNNKIKKLNEYGEKLISININYTERDALYLTNTITERISDLEFNTIKARGLVKHLDDVFSGSEEMESMSKYFEDINKLKELLIEEKKNETLLEKYEEKQKNKNEIKSISEQIKKVLSNKQKVEDLIKEFDKYILIRNEIESKTKKSEKLRDENISLNKLQKDFKKKESDMEIQISSLQSQKSKHQKNIEEIPKFKTEIDILTEKNEELKKIQIEIEEKHEKASAIKDISEKAIVKLKAVIDNISESNYPSVFEKEYIQYNDLINIIEENEKKIKIEKESLNQLNEKLRLQEGFKKEIQQFIAKGSELINKSQDSTCPLCNHDYKSFEELASKVSSNILLSKLSSDLLKERTVKETLLKKLYENVSSKKTKLIDSLRIELAEKESAHIGIIEKTVKLREDKDKIFAEREIHNKRLNSLIVSLKGLSILDFEIKQKEELTKLNTRFKTLSTDIDLLKKEVIKCSEKIKINEKEIISNQEELNILKTNFSLVVIQTYFKENHSNIDINKEFLLTQLTKISELIIKKDKEELDLKKNIESIEEILKEHTKDSIINHLNELESKKKVLARTIKSFEHFVKANLSVNPSDYTLDTFSKLLYGRKEVLQKDIADYELKSKDFKLLSQLKENIIPYLKFEKSKIQEKNTEERIYFLKNKIAKKLKAEKSKVSEHINEQINSFFYEDLINDLYRRIDPHPDYKHVKFICDFTDSKPKLNVCVYQDNEDELIIPNLYFSTAQLNILSLSIFLAKALNAKDENKKPYDCIFIDDPIQSLDSINILSTIDLLRSIVLNHKKQIILSTHDENFHNLLKKKMPPNLFKSKFMELETFGKVKKEMY